MQNVIITALAFTALYQLSSRTNIRPLVSACIVALVPFSYALIIRTIFGVSPLNLVQWSDVFMLTLQFAAAFLVFYKLYYDDSHATWIIWGVLGLMTITILIPSFVLFLIRL